MNVDVTMKGGASIPGAIYFESKRCISLATLGRKGEIETLVLVRGDKKSIPVGQQLAFEKKVLASFILRNPIQFAALLPLIGLAVVSAKDPSLLGCLLSLMAPYLIFGSTDIFRLHSAEHMVINCALNGERIVIENVLEQSWFNLHCGCLDDLIFIGAFALFLAMHLHIVLSLLLGYAVGYVFAKVRRLPATSKKLERLSMWAQRLFCYKPTEKHLEVAIAAMIQLAEAEIKLNGVSPRR